MPVAVARMDNDPERTPRTSPEVTYLAQEAASRAFLKTLEGMSARQVAEWLVSKELVRDVTQRGRGLSIVPTTIREADVEDNDKSRADGE